MKSKYSESSKTLAGVNEELINCNYNVINIVGKNNNWLGKPNGVS